MDVDIIRNDGRNVIVANGLNQGDMMITSALNYPLDGMQLALADKTTNDGIKSETEQLAVTDLALVKE